MDDKVAHEVAADVGRKRRRKGLLATQHRDQGFGRLTPLVNQGVDRATLSLGHLAGRNRVPGLSDVLVPPLVKQIEAVVQLGGMASGDIDHPTSKMGDDIANPPRRASRDRRVGLDLGVEYDTHQSLLHLGVGIGDIKQPENPFSTAEGQLSSA